jgi:hypothetical protein
VLPFLLLVATKLFISVFEITSIIESDISATFLVCFKPSVPFALILGFAYNPAFCSIKMVTYWYIFFSSISSSLVVLALPASNALRTSLVASKCKKSLIDPAPVNRESF